MFHSDHGAQYGSRAFADLCDRLGVTRSMGAVGTSADNAACESFHASLKRETLQGTRDGDAGTCRRTGFTWLTRYSTRRRHSTNGHLSPNESMAAAVPAGRQKLREELGGDLAAAGAEGCCVEPFLKELLP